MDFKQFGRKYILRLDKGEEILETLKNFCSDQKIKLGWLKGIGSVEKITIGLFATRSKEYHSINLEGDFEMTSLLGNISTMNGATYLHLHVCLGDKKYRTWSGHLSYGIISATGEIMIDSIEGEVNRKFNQDIGLNLYNFQ